MRSNILRATFAVILFTAAAVLTYISSGAGLLTLMTAAADAYGPVGALFVFDAFSDGQFTVLLIPATILAAYGAVLVSPWKRIRSAAALLVAFAVVAPLSAFATERSGYDALPLRERVTLRALWTLDKIEDFRYPGVAGIYRNQVRSIDSLKMRRKWTHDYKTARRQAFEAIHAGRWSDAQTAVSTMRELQQ